MSHPFVVSLLGFLTGLFLTVRAPVSPAYQAFPQQTEQSVGSPASSFKQQIKNTNTPSPSPTNSPSPTTTSTPTNTPTPTKSPTPTPTRKPTNTPTSTMKPVSGQPKDGYTSMLLATERGNFSVRVISINMNSAEMITDAATPTDCADNCPVKSLGAYVADNHGFAGINGTYFCPPDYAECAGKKNSFDFPVFNTPMNQWINGSHFMWKNRAILYINKDGKLRFNRNSIAEAQIPWTTVGAKAGIVNSPGLLDNGTVIADQYELTEKQKARGMKAGIGFGGTTVYLVLAYNVDMTDFGYVFKALGASYALNLDAGGSTAMWYGMYRAGPGRSLPNAIIFKVK